MNCLEDHAHLQNKEQIMTNLLFTFPKHIFTEHLYIPYHVYRYIKILITMLIRILITIATTALMLIINNIINNNNKI